MEAVYQFFETSTVWSINYSGLYRNRRCDNDTREEEEEGVIIYAELLLLLL